MKTIYLVLLSICLLVVGIVFFASKAQTTKEIDESVCEEIYNINLNSICYLLISKDINSCNNVDGYDTFCFDIVSEVSDISESFCDSINNSYGKLICYKNLAIKTWNTSFCMNNEDCYLLLASENLNASICDFFPEGTLEKYVCMAAATKNREYCQNIEDDFQRKLCLMKLPQGPDDCILVDDQYDSDCLFKLASKNKDVEICKMANVENMQIKCMLNIKNNLETCGNYTGTSKHICIIYYLKNEIESNRG